jgi:FtsP/CotA-like multicopper oxidase with cupredoxin domain
MKRFIQGEHRGQGTLLPESLDDYVSDTNPVAALDAADRQEPTASEPSAGRLEEKIAKLKTQMKELQAIEIQLNESPDKQVSLTDPDARSMMTRGTGIVGYNVQTAVDTQHHLIVAHEVTNVGSDRDQLSSMAKQAREAMASDTLSVVADRGYFKSEQILACHDAGITAYVPKPMTSGATADGRFNNDAFIYDAAKNEYICPAGEALIWRYTNVEKGLNRPGFSRHLASSLRNAFQTLPVTAAC